MKPFETGDWDDMDSEDWDSFLDEYGCVDYWLDEELYLVGLEEASDDLDGPDEDYDDE